MGDFWTVIQNEMCFRRYLDTGNHVNLWFTSDVFEVGSAGNKVNPTPKHHGKYVQPNFHYQSIRSKMIDKAHLGSRAAQPFTVYRLYHIVYMQWNEIVGSKQR